MYPVLVERAHGVISEYSEGCTEFVKEDSPFCLTRAITRTMIDPCYTPLSILMYLERISVFCQPIQGYLAYKKPRPPKTIE